MSILPRIKARLATNTAFAGAGLSPEYDVVNEILEITARRLLPIKLKWEHVKGHQDAVRKWYELTRMETLNVRAGAHATTALTNNANPPKQICMIPSSKQDRPLNSKYRHHQPLRHTSPEGSDSSQDGKTILQTLRLDTSTGCQDRLDSSP